MPRPLHTDERGFTLVELLAVILIIGILAAIAIPAFLGQRQKSQDANAKADARNLVSQMEVCYRNTDGYRGCRAELASGTGLPIGAGPGQVRIVDETDVGYEIQAVSAAETGGDNHTFTITQNIDGVSGRTCAPAGDGGCASSGSW